MSLLRRYFILITFAVLVISPLSGAVALDKKKAASGETQVVAKLNGREITITDLKSEMMRLGLASNSADAERMALDSIVNRALLADAARQANLHRQPEALRRMAIAQQQALADIYIGRASQPPEPTRAEVEDYITDNPDLFSKRRIYTFSVLSLDTKDFDQKDRSSLFDEAENFDALSSILNEEKVAHVISPLRQASNGFPAPVRKQLSEYDVRDNIVIKGDLQTQILKITKVERAAMPSTDALRFARQALLQENAQKRAEKLLANLKNKSTLAYYRKSAAPQAVKE